MKELILMDEYTPGTAVVRAGYVVARAFQGLSGERVDQEFDRWLAAEIRKAKVEAWEVGFSRGFYKAQVMPSNADASEATTPNPYEATS